MVADIEVTRITKTAARSQFPIQVNKWIHHVSFYITVKVTILTVS